MEKWKEIPGYQGDYEVSTEGHIRSIKIRNRWGVGTLDTPYVRVEPKGRQVMAVKRTRSGKRKLAPINVGRTVAKAFIPNPDRKPYVIHIDGNIANNSMLNLKWATSAEIAAICHPERLEPGYKTYKMKKEEIKKKNAAFRKKYGCTGVHSKPIIIYDELMQPIRTYSSIKECAEDTGVSRQTVMSRLKMGFDCKFSANSSNHFYAEYVKRRKSK